MAPSDTPPGTLPQPGADAFPPSPPHAVTAYARSRWASGLARWWQASFGRNAYARGADTVRAGRSGHRFFQHLIDADATDERGATDHTAPGSRVPAPARLPESGE